MARLLLVLAFFLAVPTAAQVDCDGAAGFECRQSLVPGSTARELGSAVALRGDVAVVGGRDGILIFRWENARWLLKGEEGISGGQFGLALTIGDNTLGEDEILVGAPAAGAGEVSILDVSGESTGSIVPPVEVQPGDRFGFALALGGGYLAVGAPRSGDSRGAVYVYREDWPGPCELSDAADGDQFGTAVALSDKYLVVGAPFAETGGAVDVFSLGSTCEELRNQIPAKLLPADSSPVDAFGFAVAVAGETIVVGAPQDDKGGVDAGAVYFFRDTDAAWGFQEPIPGEEPVRGENPGDQFGVAVAFDGERALVGARRYDATAARDAGAVYLLRRSENWTRQRFFDGDQDGEELGVVVALDGRGALVGAHHAAYALGENANLGLILTRDAPATELLEPGEGLRYRIKITHGGPEVEDAELRFTPSSSLSEVRWRSCVGPGACGPWVWLAEGQGSLESTVDLDGELIYVVRATHSDADCGSAVTSRVELNGIPPGLFSAEPLSVEVTDDVDPKVDLAIEISPDRLSEVPGGMVIYTISATSQGPCTAARAEVSVDPAAALTGAEWTCAPSQENACACGMSCPIDSSDIVTLQPNATASYTLKASVASGLGMEEEVSLEARIKPPEGMENPGANCLVPDPAQASCAVETFLIGTAYGIEIDDGGLETGVPGEEVAFTVRVTNDGFVADEPATLLGFLTRQLIDVSFGSEPEVPWACPDPLRQPLGLYELFTDDVSFLGSTSPVRSATCVVRGTIDPATTDAELRFGALIEPPPGIDNVAPEPCADPPPGVKPDPRASCTQKGYSLRRKADLSITLECDPDGVVAGEEVSCTLKVENDGRRAVGNVEVSIQYPAQKLIDASWSCEGNAPRPVDGSARKTVTLPRGGGLRCWLTARLNPEAGPVSGDPGILSLRAAVQGPDGLDDPPENNEAFLLTPVLRRQSDLEISIGSNRRNGIKPGQGLRYTIRAMSSGGADLDDVSVRVDFPQELGEVAWSCLSQGQDCGKGHGSIEERVSLPGGGSLTYTATATLPLDLSRFAPLVTTASIAVPPGVDDTDLSNNRESASIEIRVGVSGTKIASFEGGDVVYRIELTNESERAQADVELEDDLPQGLALMSADAPKGDLDLAGNRVKWTCSSPCRLRREESVEIFIRASAVEGFAGTVSNQAVIHYTSLGVDGTSRTDDPAVPGPADPTLVRIGSPLLIPALSRTGLVALALLLAAAAGWLLRRS